jgi:hypothetical protein
MGTWGINITDDDLYKDIEYKFLNLYNEGIDVNIITKKIIENYNESLNSDKDSNGFWLSIAYLQWQCKSLDKLVFDKVKDIVESKSDLQLWEELGASKSEINKREKILSEFLIKISTPKKSPKRRIKKKLFNSIYKKGDCLSFKLRNGKYGSALVIDEEENTEFGSNTIVISNLEQEKKPTIDDLKKAGIRYYKDGNQNEEFYFPYISHVWATHFAEDSTDMDITVIGKLKIRNNNINVESMVRWVSLSRNNDSNLYDIKNPLKISDFIEKTSFIEKIKNWL